MILSKKTKQIFLEVGTDFRSTLKDNNNKVDQKKKYFTCL